MLAYRTRRPAWEAVKTDWPNAKASRFVEAGGIEWHVQIMGDQSAPSLLLLHGTGASAHSFRDLMPALAERYCVVTPDLPGHGFTATPPNDGLSLTGMSALVAALLHKLDKEPKLAAGHSAGAAVLLQMALSGRMKPDRIVSINGALEPIQGNALFSPMARLLFLNPLVPRMFALHARFGETADMILNKTGSVIDPVGRNCYRILVRSSEHVEGALGMMANWDLLALVKAFSKIPVPVTLIAAEDDPAVPASVSRRAAAAIPDAKLVLLPKGGHLLHEADWQDVAGLILEPA
ncbi:MAG: alpha/beta fold hydrolase BchO [Pseudomonadota bacterium]